MVYQPDPDDYAAWAGRSWRTVGLRSWQWTGDPLARDWTSGAPRFEHIPPGRHVPPTLMQLAERRTLREFTPEMRAVREYLSTPRLPLDRMLHTPETAVKEASDRRYSALRGSPIRDALLTVAAPVVAPPAVVREVATTTGNGWEMVVSIYDNGMTTVHPRRIRSPHDLALEAARNQRDSSLHAQTVRAALLQASA